MTNAHSLWCLLSQLILTILNDMLGKVYIVLDFANEQEKEQVQDILKEVSNLRLFTGTQLLSIYPFVRAHQREVMQLFALIKKGGPKALLSIEGAMLVKSLMK